MLLHQPKLSLANNIIKAMKNYVGGKCSVSVFQWEGAQGNHFNIIQSFWLKCFPFSCICLGNILFQLFICFKSSFMRANLFAKCFLQLKNQSLARKNFCQGGFDQSFYSSSWDWQNWLILYNSQHLSFNIPIYESWTITSGHIFCIII